MNKLAAAFALSLMMSTAAFAAGTESTPSEVTADVDFTSVKAKLAANDYKGAITELTALSTSNQSPDLFNYLGYASRKDGQLQSAAFYYAKALAADPAHKGALAYQGELFLMIGKPDQAKSNLEQLKILCAKECSERTELEEAIKKAGLTN